MRLSWMVAGVTWDVNRKGHVYKGTRERESNMEAPDKACVSGIKTVSVAAEPVARDAAQARHVILREG